MTSVNVENITDTVNTVGHNSNADLKKFEAAVRQLGTDQAKGDDSQIKLAILMTGAAAEKLINLEYSHPDTTDTWLNPRSIPAEYKKGAMDAAARYYHMWSEKRQGATIHNKKSIKVQESKMRPFVRIGAHNEIAGPAFIQRVIDRWNKHQADGQATNGLLVSMTALARKQLDTWAKDGALTDEQLDEQLVRGETDTSDIAILTAVWKRIDALVEREEDPMGIVPMDPENEDDDAPTTLDVVRQAQSMIADAVEALGGERPAVKKKEPKTEETIPTDPAQLAAQLTDNPALLARLKAALAAMPDSKGPATE